MSDSADGEAAVHPLKAPSQGLLIIYSGVAAVQ